MFKKILSFVLVSALSIGFVSTMPTYAKENNESKRYYSSNSKNDLSKQSSNQKKDNKNDSETTVRKGAFINSSEYENVIKEASLIVEGEEYTIKKIGEYEFYCLFEAKETGFYDLTLSSKDFNYYTIYSYMDLGTDINIYDDTNYFSCNYTCLSNKVCKNNIYGKKGHTYLVKISNPCAQKYVFGLDDSQNENSYIVNSTIKITKNNENIPNIALGDNNYKEKNYSRLIYEIKPQKTEMYSISDALAIGGANNLFYNELERVEIINKNDDKDRYLMYRNDTIDGIYRFELKEGNEYYICITGCVDWIDNGLNDSAKYNGEYALGTAFDNICEVNFKLNKKEISKFEVTMNENVLNTFEEPSKFDNTKYNFVITYTDGTKDSFSDTRYILESMAGCEINYEWESQDLIKAGMGKAIITYFDHSCICDIKVENGYNYARKNGKKYTIGKIITQNDYDGKYIYFTPTETGMYDWYKNYEECTYREFEIRDSKDNVIDYTPNEGYKLVKGKTYACYMDSLYYNYVLYYSKNHKHKVVTDKKVEPTTTKTGLTKGSHCLVCGKVIEKQKVIPKIKIKLNKTSLKLKKGKSTTLKLTGTKSKVTWSTSNKKIAKVSKNGKVTAVKKGKVNIIASVGGKKYVCKVTCTK